MRIAATALNRLIADGGEPLLSGIDFDGILIVDVDDMQAVPPQWLARLPCPAIARVAEGLAAAAGGFDLVAGDDALLDRMLAAIDAHPIAAMTLMQTLRLIEAVDLDQGLTVESLAFATLQQGPEFRSWLEGRGETADPVDRPADILLLERQDDCLTITLNDPAHRNEIGVRMRDALFEAYAFVAMDQEIERVEVRGTGDSFSIGGALCEFGSTPSAAVAHQVRCLRLPARMLVGHAHKYHFHMQGACIGAGIEMAAFGGRITAAPTTFFQLPELAMGLIPGAGGCVGVSRRIGRQRTARMVVTGERVRARTALEWGLIDGIED